MSDFIAKFFVHILVGLILLLGGLLIRASWVEQKEWQAFADAHDCQIVSRKKSQVNMGVGVSSSGGTVVMPVVEDAQVAYLCDDGVTYWR